MQKFNDVTCAAIIGWSNEIELPKWSSQSRSNEWESWMQKFNDVACAAIIGWSNGIELAEVQLTIQIDRGTRVLVSKAEGSICALLLASDTALRPLHDGCRVLLRVAVSLKPDVFEFQAADRVIRGRNNLGDRWRGMDLAHERVAVLIGSA